MSARTQYACASVCLLLLSWFACEMRAQQNVAGTSRFKVAWSTYFGGSAGEQAREVIPYPDGSVLVGGQTSSPNLPTTPGVVQPTYAGDDPALGHPGIYGGDCFLTRLSADGKKIIWATYFGGSKQERNVYGMALDRRGNIVITTTTRSPDLPTTPGCFQPKYGGGPSDWCVAKLSPDGKRLLWCTYVGGSGDESPRGGLDVDAQDNVYIVGGTQSPNFPTTPGVVQPTRKGPSDTAIVKLKPEGSLVWSTLLGGSGEDATVVGVMVDAAGDAYLGGHTQSADFPVTDGSPQPRLGGQSDCFLTKLSKDGSRLLYSTFLGGRLNEFAEHRLCLAPDGSVLLTGFTASPDFPTTEGAFQRSLRGNGDGFLTKLSADGKRFTLSTLLGGSDDGEFYLMPTLDARGNIYVVGQTSSQDFPVTSNAVQKTYGGGGSDGTLAVFSPDGSRLLYATYLGGNDNDMIRSMALGPNGEVYLVGSTASKDFPVTRGALQPAPGGKGDAFVVKMVREH